MFSLHTVICKSIYEYKWANKVVVCSALVNVRRASLRSSSTQMFWAVWARDLWDGPHWTVGPQNPRGQLTLTNKESQTKGCKHLTFGHISVHKKDSSKVRQKAGHKWCAPQCCLVFHVKKLNYINLHCHTAQTEIILFIYSMHCHNCH